MICDAMRVVSIRQERYRVPCGSRYCPACGERWSKDQRVRAVAAAKDLPGDAALLTITGPGNDYFNPPGLQGAYRKKVRLRTWNRTARERWTRLHRAASRAARRWAREHGSDWRLLYRTWEWQRRGVLHLHLVVPMATPQDRYATLMYVRALWTLAREHEFGYVLGGDSGEEPGWERPPRVPRASANAVAAYVSKYVTKAGPRENGMVSVARAAGMRGSVVYIAQHLLARSGVTMGTLRDRRRIVGRYPFAVTGERGWEEACLVDAVQRGRPPLAEDAVEAIRALAGRVVAVAVSHGPQRVLLWPTRAPRPLGLGGYPAEVPPPGAVGVVSLASVLLRVPEPEHLGWERTVVVGCAS